MLIHVDTAMPIFLLIIYSYFVRKPLAVPRITIIDNFISVFYIWELFDVVILELTISNVIRKIKCIMIEIFVIFKDKYNFCAYETCVWDFVRNALHKDHSCLNNTILRRRIIDYTMFPGKIWESNLRRKAQNGSEYNNREYNEIKLRRTIREQIQCS